MVFPSQFSITVPDNSAYVDVATVDEDIQTGGCIAGKDEEKGQPVRCRYNWYLNSGDVRRCLSSPHTFKLVSWLGTTMWIHTDTALHLRDEYGPHWRTPASSGYQPCYDTKKTRAEFRTVNRTREKIEGDSSEFRNRAPGFPTAAEVLALQSCLEVEAGGLSWLNHLRDRHQAIMAIVPSLADAGPIG